MSDTDERSVASAGSSPAFELVSFGLGRFEPRLEVGRLDGLMYFGAATVPEDDHASWLLEREIARSGLHGWWVKLMQENIDTIPEGSDISGPYGLSWNRCPAEIGEKALDMLVTVIREAMGRIIPTMTLGD